MGPLGWQETLVIFVLILVLFGPKELPKVGKNIAKAIGEFRRTSSELKDTWHREMANLERETEDIKKESESLAQTTSSYMNDDAGSSTSYNYDSSYDYGAYGTPENYDSSSPATTESSSPVSASAIQDADSPGTAPMADAANAPESQVAEGTIPAGTNVDVPADGAPAAPPVAPESAASR